MNQSASNLSRRKVLGALCLLGLGGLIPVSLLHRGKPTSREANRVSALQNALNQTDQHWQRMAWARWQEVNLLFHERRQRLPEWLDHATRLKAKWRLVRGDLDRHLVNLFEQHVLSAKELQQSLERAIRGLINDIEASENRLLVRLRVDLPDHPLWVDMDSALSPGDLLLSMDTFLQHALVDGEILISHDAGMDLSSLLTAEIATVLTVQLMRLSAIRLGVSSALISTGAAASGWTFGASLVAGLLLDYWVSALMRRWYNPAGKLLDELYLEYDQISSQILYGDSLQEGLAGLLNQMVSLRVTWLGTKLHESL